MFGENGKERRRRRRVSRRNYVETLTEALMFDYNLEMP
jgi:hypothetical protein